MTTYIPSLTLPAFAFENPAVAVLIPVVAGSAVGWSTRHINYKTRTYDHATADRSQKTYKELKQPPFAPPPYVFGPVWTVLYAGMGYAAYRAWSTAGASFDVNKAALVKHGATLYTIQLGLNLLWMPLFFGFYRPIEATVDIVALTGVTGYLTYIWGKVDRVSGWLLASYLGWLSFATYLSAGVGYLNGWNLKKVSSEAKKSE